MSHLVFLDRPATEAEKTSWEARFASGEPRYRLPRELATSDEWLTVVVTDLYQQALDRGPDRDGLAFWIDQLRAGALVNRVASLIYSSDEYYATAGGTDAAFVADLYGRILGRAPDGPGQTHWQDQVTTLGRGRVAALFFASVESRGDRVDALYRQILGRPAEPAGRAHWIDQLATINDVRLAVLFASSTESIERASSVCTTTTRITDGNDDSGGAAISSDGRHITFGSFASDLVADDRNGFVDVFTWDCTAGVITRITDGSPPRPPASCRGLGRRAPRTGRP